MSTTTADTIGDIRSRLRRPNMSRKSQYIWLGVIALAIVTFTLIISLIAGAYKRQPFAHMLLPAAEFNVQAGNNLAKAARQHNGDPIVAALMNAYSLEGHYTMACPAGQASAWPEQVRTSAYCNKGLVLPWASTLKPGMMLRLPAAENGVPLRATHLVAGMSGHIALLINAAAGQSTFDAAAAVTMAIENSHKGLTQNDIWVYDPAAHTMVNYLQRGTVLPLDRRLPSTTAALGMLKFSAIDQVLLVTNEAGIQKVGTGGSKPVFGLCTAGACVSPMAALTKATGGKNANYNE